MVLDLDDIVLVIWILLLQMLQDAQLNTSLMLILFFVLDDLDGHDLISLVVEAFQGLSKTTLAEEVEHLEAIVDVVLEDHVVVTILIIITRVM